MANKIIFYNNIDSTTNEVKYYLYMNVNVLDTISGNNYPIDNNPIKDTSNLIILSYNIKRLVLGTGISTNLIDSNICLLTQKNLNHNMVFFYLNNDFSKPRLLLTKHRYFINYKNHNNYLLNQSLPIKSNEYKNILTKTIGKNANNKYSFNSYLNFYKNFCNSEYYKFKFSDFNFNVSNNNGVNITTTVDNSFNNDSNINYDINNFKNIYYYSDTNYNTDTQDISKIELLPSDTNIYGFDLFYNSILNNNNFLIYNKPDNLTSYYDNVSTLNFFTKKAYIDNEFNGKILFNKNFTLLNVSYLSDLCSNNNVIKDKIDNSNIIFLSLNNSITGLTQKQLLSNVKLDYAKTSNNKTLTLNKIHFTIPTKISSTNQYELLKNDLSKNFFLLDNKYSHNAINITSIFNQTSAIKRRELDLNNFLKGIFTINSDSNNVDTNAANINYNIYKQRFNSLLLLNTNNSITKDYFNTTSGSEPDKYSYEYIINENNIVNYSNNFYISDVNITNKTSQENIRLKINSKDYNTSYLQSNVNTSFNNNNNDRLLNLDFRFNYLQNFDLSINFDLKYNLNRRIDGISNELLYNFEFSNNIVTNNGDYINLLLNFYKIQFVSNIVTSAGSDFTNVDCIFVYHNPTNETDPSFLYPYNNIEIITNSEIDTFARAIELLPNARTSRTNSVFIPAKNGSNLSRKMIQGLVGLNDVPKLLSIKPYDETFTNGRGFINQYQIEDECENNNTKILKKLNAIKHNEVKQKSTLNSNNYVVNSQPRRQNFANIVRSNARNRLSLQCASNLINNQETVATNVSNLNVYTPFKLFKTNKGKYL